MSRSHVLSVLDGFNIHGINLLILCIILSRAAAATSAEGKHFALFFHPPPGFCFPNSQQVYLATSISDGLFLRDDVREHGLRMRLVINDQEVADVTWRPNAGMESDEGISHHFHVPGLEDGEYEATFLLISLGTGKQVGQEATTLFVVEEATNCTETYGQYQSLHAVPSQQDSGKVLLNVARNKSSWMSCEAPGREAKHANDGSMMVSQVIDWRAETCNGKRTEHGVWWEVDLGESTEIELIDILEGQRPAARGSYPPILAAVQPLLPLRVSILSSDWSEVKTQTLDAQTLKEELSASGGRGIFSWLGVSATGRYVRLEALEAEGMVEERILSLLEVAVFSSVRWNCSRHCPPQFGSCPPTDPVLGQCVCKPNRIGIDCSTHLLTDHLFLPPYRHPQDSEDQVNFSWLQASAWDHQEFEEALREVAASQGSGSCTAPAALVMGYHPGGLTASLSLIASMLSLSFALNKKMLLWRKAEWFYADPGECPDKQMSCYFDSWSDCSHQDIDNFLEGTFHLKVEESDNTRSVQPFAWVPPKYQSKGIFWWRTVLNSFLFRIRPELAQELDIDGMMKRLGLLDGPFIGVHVRLGDSCVKWKELFNGDCLSLDEHISHTKFLSDRYHVQKVFVASDDPHALDHFKQKLPSLHVVAVDKYRSLLEEMEKTKNEWTENRLRKGELPRSLLLRSTLTDLILLAKAAFFVGHMASNLSRLAYSLAVAMSSGRLIPFLSVDGPWCYHWQLCCDVDADGLSHMCS
uniref:EGF-like domain-containing protein n=1 Tax=Guillardia theta TaxID=55529 RepID=A0A7S4NGE0_GUITH|mmetsp:Transcript_21454/g.71079  ORF Transcript_21454/g.71079 Transcript_21454/m.71079 type:complete len:752 (+) Transcript_21454:125-2380(+)